MCLCMCLCGVEEEAVCGGLCGCVSVVFVCVCVYIQYMHGVVFPVCSLMCQIQCMCVLPVIS